MEAVATLNLRGAPIYSIMWGDDTPDGAWLSTGSRWNKGEINCVGADYLMVWWPSNKATGVTDIYPWDDYAFLVKCVID